MAGAGERPYHKKNRFGCLSATATARMQDQNRPWLRQPGLGHSPLVGSEAATEVFNPAAPLFSPPYTTLPRHDRAFTRTGAI